MSNDANNLANAAAAGSGTPTFLGSGLNAASNKIISTGTWSAYDYIAVAIVTRATNDDRSWVTWPTAYIKASQLASGFSIQIAHRSNVTFSYASTNSYNISVQNASGGLTYHTITGWA